MSKRVWKRVYAKLDLFLLLLIPLAWYVVFKYVPMYGLQIAFRRFNPSLGITASPWVGMRYFSQFFDSYYFWEIIYNTISLSIYQLAIGFPIPIFLALLINEIQHKRLQRTVQNITYI
ncbi:MAG: sugar ABC transporter permease, partial [Spirochaetales bacterium]|nr:sugar ABC transporter permease [Spirochaetales bacterium]